MSTRFDDEPRTVSMPASSLPAADWLPFFRSLVALDSVSFAAICLGDMLSTLYWVHEGRATEANPWLAACLARGPAVFCAAKILSFLPMLAVAAYYRGLYPKFVPLALRLGIAGYLVVYFAGVGCQFFHAR